MSVLRMLGRLLPKGASDSIYAYVARRNANRWLQEKGVFELALQVAEKFDYKVQSGPFQGMKYTESAVLSRHATPTLIGQYEGRVYSSLMAAASRADLVIDIGHAEGYYAVGFARLGKQVVAFDIDPHERRVCREMAEANGVTDRISFHSRCTPALLRSLTLDRATLIISDIDGGELDLFTPQLISDLRHCEFVIELHAQDAKGNQSFINRFAETHRPTIIDHVSEALGAEMITFLGVDGPRMAYEYRSFQQWLIASPLHAPLQAMEEPVAAHAPSGYAQSHKSMEYDAPVSHR